MGYKKNEAPDSEKVSLTMSMAQVRFLEKMVSAALADVEEFGEDEFNKAKPLQKLIDVLFPIVNTKMSEAEELATTDAWVKEFTKSDYERAHGVQS